LKSGLETNLYVLVRKMYLKNIFSVGLLLLLISLTVACRLENVDLGSIEGSTYSNRYFGLKISIPQGWQVQDEETKRQLSESGRQKLANGNEQLEKSLNASRLNTLNLLTIFKYPRGSAVSSNPNFLCVAERINPALSGTSIEYLNVMKNLLQGSQIPHEFGEIYFQFIGEKRFFVLPVQNPSSGVKQKYYTTRMKDYNLTFIISYQTDEDSKALQEILNSVKFAE
jgi:hypothetical protein